MLMGQDSSAIELNTLVEALHKLGLVDEIISAFCKDVERTVLRPCVRLTDNGGLPLVTVEEDKLCLSGTSADRSIGDVFARLQDIMEYLHANLPPSMLSGVRRILSPLFISTIESTWLSFAVPADVEGLRGFQSTKQSVLHFADTLERYQWPGKANLVNWTKDIPRQWLNKYQEAALDKARAILAGGFLRVETVERVETQLISKKEDLFASADANDSWNAEWSDEEQPAHPQGVDATKIVQSVDNFQGEEDVNAWGLDEDAKDDNHKLAGESAPDESEDADAWGWGDDDDEEGQTSFPEPLQASPQRPKSNGVHERAHSTEREVTLTETYNITSLPKGIVSIIVQALSDAETVMSLRYVQLLCYRRTFTEN